MSRDSVGMVRALRFVLAIEPAVRLSPWQRDLTLRVLLGQQVMVGTGRFRRWL